MEYLIDSLLSQNLKIERSDEELKFYNPIHDKAGKISANLSKIEKLKKLPVRLVTGHCYCARQILREDEGVKYCANCHRKISMKKLESGIFVDDDLQITYIRHTTKTEFGYYHYIMLENGVGFARAYTFDDMEDSFLMDMLSVNNGSRNAGLGTKLQIIREKMAMELGYKKCLLWTKKGSWMEEWYKRRGYEFYSDKDDSTDDEIWMQRLLDYGEDQ